jgi:hypothetical protein
MLITALISGVLAAAPTPLVQTVQVHTVQADFVRKVGADGSLTLSGRDNRDGTPFRFTVRDGVVSGWVGDRPVKFPLSEATNARP